MYAHLTALSTAGLLALGSAPAYAQMDPRTYVYEDGVAVRAAREIIVRFEPTALQELTINNTGKQQGQLSEFLTPNALSAVSTAAGFNMAQVATGKILPNLTIADSTQLNRLGEPLPDQKLWAVLLLQLPVGVDEASVCNQLPSFGGPVLYAHLNPIARTTAVPNDTHYAANQLSLRYTAAYPNSHINVEGAWDLTTGRNGIKVGVYDSGIKVSHPDLAGVVSGGRDGYDRTRPTPYNDDVLGHGTLVAGIIGAIRNNGNGIAGVAGGDAATGAPGVQLRSYKILGDGCNGCGATLDKIVEAINDGITDGLHIMNHSWAIPRGVYSTVTTSAGHEDYRYFDEAIRLAHAARIVTVAASGNWIDEGNNYLPAHTYDPWILTVAGTGANGQWLDESNGGIIRNGYSTPNDNVDVAAPGTATLVYSTTNTGGYMGVSGTSVAAPHATGLAALMMSYWNDPGNPQNDLTPEDVENIMQNSATDKVDLPRYGAGEDDYTGRGLINATKTLNNIKKPANALLRHRITTGPANVALVGTRTGVYISGGPANLFLFPGFYDLEVYEITGIGPSDYSPDATLRGRWVQTSTTNLRGPLGPPVTVTKRDGITTVTSQASLKNENGAVYAGLAGKANAQFKGYAYRLTSMYDIEAGTSQPYTRWIPFDPYAANRPGRIDYTNHWSSNTIFARNAAGSQSAASAYPNPARGELNILLPQAETGAATVDVLSLTGQAMRREARQLKGEQLLRVPVAALRPGLYFYRVQTPTGVFQGKFTKAE